MTDAPTATNAPEFTVTELSQALKRTVEDAYGFVRVRGELGRVTIAKSGHLYADLKDDRSVLSSVMWKGGVAGLNFRPEEGLEVVCEGKLSTYPGRSQYQLIVERMAPAGVGALMALLEERKKKLAAEGLFDAKHKQRAPFLPEVVGVVTSPTGAVIRDILHRISERFPKHVIVWPVLVQGDKAAQQVAQAIQGFNALKEGGVIPRPDVVIVARGGGSIEDLWPFNEEIVVRAAFAGAIPLISAVGHETDWTLIDLVADQRAPTPTGAAELVTTPPRAELAANLATLEGRLRQSLARGLERRATELKAAARGLPRPDDLLGSATQRLDAAGAALRAALKAAADGAQIAYQRVGARLRPQALQRDIAEKRRRVDELTERLIVRAPSVAIDRNAQALADVARRARGAYGRDILGKMRAVEAAGLRLESVNPKAVLARGYALVRRADGSLARRGGDLKAGERVGVEFADVARAAVIEGEAGGTKPAPEAAPKTASGDKKPRQGALF